MGDKRKIINQKEFDDLAIEVRNRQYKSNPVIIDFTDVFEKNPDFLIDWNKEYLEITRVENVDIVKLIP
jgi:hypothetical protein